MSPNFFRNVSLAFVVSIHSLLLFIIFYIFILNELGNVYRDVDVRPCDRRNVNVSSVLEFWEDDAFEVSNFKFFV